MPREVSIEDYLVKQCAKVGVRADKYRTPGRRHAPDRICLIPGGRVVFVECKAPGKKPRPGQVREHMRLWALGFAVRVIDTKTKVDDFIKEIQCAS